MNAETLVLEELKAGNKDLEWFSKNFSELKKKYPKKFVAIKDQNVVIAASKLETLIKHLKQKFGNPNDFLIDFVPDDKYILVV
ncbi:MAG: hypothetical protein KAW45_03595 [Thermoplasmatales archaeon]|nr:hypothetical protein [Thermoplasmatales archaeon]